MTNIACPRKPPRAWPRGMIAPAPLPASSHVRRALLWRAGGQASAQALLWASTFFVLRLLAPADYGLVAMAAVVTGFLALLSGQGFTAALIQTPSLDPAQVRRFMGLLVLVNLALATAQIALAPAAAAYYRTPAVADLLRVQALAYLCVPWIAVPAALAQRALDFRTPAITDFAGAVAGAAVTLGLALGHVGVWALIAGQLVPMIVRALIWTLRGTTPVPRFGVSGIGSLANFGGAVTLNAVVWFLYAQADVVIAGRRLPAAEVGFYTTAMFLAALPVAKIVPILTEVGFSAYSRLAADPHAVRAGFLKVTRLVSLVCFPVFVGLAALAPTLVRVLLGPKWDGAAEPVRLLALAMPLYALANLFGPAVNALGRPRVQLGNAVLGVIIMPPAFWFGARSGAVGIAAAWTIAYPLLFALSAARSLRVIGLAPRALADAVGPALACALVMAGPVVAIGRLPLGDAPRLAIGVAVGIALYSGALALLWPSRLRELRALAAARPR